MHMRLADLHDQPFAKARAEWNRVKKAAVYTGNRNHASLATRLNRLPQDDWPVKRNLHSLLRIIVGSGNAGAVCLKADRVNASIGSAATSHPLQLVDKVIHFFIV